MVSRQGFSNLSVFTGTVADAALMLLRDPNETDVTELDKAIAFLTLYESIRDKLSAAGLLGSSGIPTTPVEGSVGFRGGSFAITPDTIPAFGDVDGTYNFGAEDFDVAYLASANVNQYEIWVKNEAVHQVSNWTPVADWVGEFVIDTTEETGIGLKQTDKIVPVRMVFRANGTFVALVNTWLSIGGGANVVPNPATATDGDLVQVGINGLNYKIRDDQSHQGDQIDSERIHNKAELDLVLAGRATDHKARVLIMEADVSTTFSGNIYAFRIGDVVYFPPTSATPQRWFNLAETGGAAIPPQIKSLDPTAPVGLYNLIEDGHIALPENFFSFVPVRRGSSALYQIGVNRRLTNTGSLPVFGDASVIPVASGIGAIFHQYSPSDDPDFPSGGDFRLILRTDLGQPKRLHFASAAVSEDLLIDIRGSYATDTIGGVQYTFYNTALVSYYAAWGPPQWERMALLGSTVMVSIQYGDGSSATYLQNNGAKESLEVAEKGIYYKTPDGPFQYMEARPISNNGFSTTPSPVILISNIASYDAAQNRFEDSSGDEVVVPDGAIATLTQAVYDAAVADAQFTPNKNAIFLTR